jgi:hypothetical protein
MVRLAYHSSIFFVDPAGLVQIFLIAIGIGTATLHISF